nr:TetR/AcrR family transcriptional regulator [Mesorhizobium sp.]
MASSMRQRQPQAGKEDGRLLRGEATRERVLDAAELLFADLGFDGVSIRQIAEAAGVTLGVVGFHSGSKLDLFKTILQRRVEALSSARREALRAVVARYGQSVPVREIMSAYIGPYIDVASLEDRQWHAYARLIAHMVSDERWYPFVKDLYDPVAREFLAVIRAARPEADEDRLAAAFVMSVASMLSIVASTVRIAALGTAAKGSTKPSPADLRSTLIDFCTGGIEAALHRPQGQR